MGTASKLFWKTLQGPEVKPVELYFGILNSDSKSNNFQKMLKKKVVSVVDDSDLAQFNYYLVYHRMLSLD